MIFFSGNPSKFTRTNVHQVSSPQKKGSHFFMTPVKPFPSACLSDLFRHGIRNNASERPSGRKPREEAHSLEFSESSSDSYPLFNGSLRKKRTSKKVATFLFVFEWSEMFTFWGVLFLLTFLCWHLKGLGGSGSDTFLFYVFPSAVFLVDVSISPNHPKSAYSTHTKSMVTWSWYAQKKRHLRFRGWVPPITPHKFSDLHGI